MMFEHYNLTKNEFLARNRAAIGRVIGHVNAQLSTQYGSGLQPLTSQDFWLVFQAEAAIDHRGHVDPAGRHSLGERGVLPLPANVRFWNGPSAPDPKQPHPLKQNLSQYALYLGQLKNKVVRQRGRRAMYPDLFYHPGIDGNPMRMAKLLAGVVHGYFFGGNYRTGIPPDDALLDGYARDMPISDMLRNTTYVHAGTSILENRQRNLDAALEHFEKHNPTSAMMWNDSDDGNTDGRHILLPDDTPGLSDAAPFATFSSNRTGTQHLPASQSFNLDAGERTLIELGKSAGVEEGMKRILSLHRQKSPNTMPRYWAIADFNKQSGLRRLYLFDRLGKVMIPYLCAHGIGSDSDADDGYAISFSNKLGSHKSSLGIYRCAEPYNGAHGKSLRLDGLDATNSNARARAIVLHGADYVSPEVVAQTGRVGRSHGCPAVEKRYAEGIVDQLSHGSYLMIWHDQILHGDVAL